MRRILLLIVGLFFPISVLAQPALLPACAESGNCGFCDIADVIGRGFEFLLYFLGAVIFFVFMWGALDMITSRGRSEQLEKGKEEMKGALFGALFVLIAWHVINLMVYTLITPVKDPLAPKRDSTDESGEPLFGNPWNWLCSEKTTGGEACFSRGDGTPCAQDQICIQGECGKADESGTKHANTCDYLKAKYPDEFNSSYACKPKPDPNTVPKRDDDKVQDCLPDPSFCGFGVTDQFCCGFVGAP